MLFAFKCSARKSVGPLRFSHLVQTWQLDGTHRILLADRTSPVSPSHLQTHPNESQRVFSSCSHDKVMFQVQNTQSKEAFCPDSECLLIQPDKLQINQQSAGFCYWPVAGVFCGVAFSFSVFCVLPALFILLLPLKGRTFTAETNKTLENDGASFTRIWIRIRFTNRPD